ncbi:putative GATA zinc finger protein [Lyophyllum shimeji]|uniref:GATA zinc finger protein n=1 Tax=Lyophyllum shimeji TaxID=47721 RepID=A0A9P3PEW2_LYOSH|nr:putative GATA zinc finger protein [Lyophyllum shimeji]
MDSLHFDAYTAYSDSSAPRTPSPHDVHFVHDPHYKALDVQPRMEPRIYAESDVPDDGAVSVDPHYWSPPHQQQSSPFPYNPRGSLLQELYDHDLAEQQQQQPYLDQPSEPQPFHHVDNWNQHVQQSQPLRHQDYTLPRRATFPYVRQDRDDALQLQYPPSFMHQQHQQHDGLRSYPSRSDAIYGEPISESQDSFIPSMSNSPHQSYHEFDDSTAIKLEDTQPLMVPSQPAGFYRPPSSSGCHPMTMSYLSPHTGLPVQHTDDAASKETQYLRRRCFNCHTTEPPSWRRSTLNPGKIVCNKCGLYERTHLRPRPLRFDELRAGNKARSNKTKGTISPKAKMTLVKKEPREYGLVRRSSVSSSSSVHSGSGASDWDDNVSVYSSGSAPPTSFNSPNAGTFPLSRGSQSPPHDGGIRLPNAPLSDIATMSPSQQPLTLSPRKSHTAPTPYFSSPPQSGANGVQQEYYRRGSISEVQQQQQDSATWQGQSNVTASPQSGLELTLPPADGASASVGGHSPVPAAAAVPIPATSS